MTRTITLALLASLAASAHGAATRPEEDPVDQHLRVMEAVHPEELQRFVQASGRAVKTFTQEEIGRHWSMVTFKPYEQAGFNVLVLPFHLVAEPTKENLATSRALAFLISGDLDWSRRCYNTRHAYFVFKRDREAMLSLEKGYQPVTIRGLIKDWHATHALGGAFHHDAKGWSLDLILYDAQGRIAWNTTGKHFTSFWELLGESSCTLLSQMGTPPNAALTKHLHQQRAHHPLTLLWLGNAAFAPEKTPAEFQLYQQILGADPQFAEVRYWYHNQKMWSDDNRAEYMLHSAMAMENRLLEAPLGDFDPDDCPDPKLAARYPEWIRQAREFVGPDHPTLLRYELSHPPAEGPELSKLLQRAMPVASELPNDRWLLINLARRLHALSPGAGGPDHDVAGSLAWICLNNRAMASVGRREEELAELSTAALALGYHDLACRIPGLRGGPRDLAERYNLAKGLFAAGRYADVLRGYELARGKADEQKWLSRLAGPAAFFLGRSRYLEEILTRHEAELQSSGTLPLARYALAFLRSENPGPPPDPSPGFREFNWNAVNLACRWLWDQRQQRPQLREFFQQVLREMPLHRDIWIAFDSYERRKPSAFGTDFYFMLSDLYPDDELAASLVRDFVARGGSLAARTKAAEFQAEFKTFHATAWMKMERGALEREVHRLKAVMPVTRLVSVFADGMARREYRETLAMAQDFLDLASLTQHDDARNIARHFVYQLRCKLEPEP